MVTPLPRGLVPDRMGIMGINVASILRPSRRWLQYSLRSLLLLTLLLSLAMGWLANRAITQRRAVRQILEVGGTVRYGYQFAEEMHGLDTYLTGGPQYVLVKGERTRFVPDAEPPGPEWLRELIGIDYLDNVVRVELRDNDRAHTALMHIGALRKVWFVDLTNTPVGDEQLAYLAELPALRTLKLADTKVTDAGLQHLKNLHRLEWLDVSRTGVTDAGLEHLRALPSLREIDLLGTRVSEKGVTDLQRALPGAMIIWQYERKTPSR